MRILYVTAHYPPDFVSGATLQVRRLAVEAASQGHDVRVLSGAIGKGLADGATIDEEVEGVTIHWIGTATRVDPADDANWLNPLARAVAASILDDWRPEVVHAHALQTIGAGPLDEAIAREIPTVVTMHDMWWWCPRLFLVDRELRPCALVTSRSDCECARTAGWRRQRADVLAATRARVGLLLTPSTSARELVVLNGVPSARVEVDENDVDPAASTPILDGRVAAVDRIWFVYVGGPSPLKGAQVLLTAAARLPRRDRWALTLYGVPDPRRGLRGRLRHRRLRNVTFLPPYEPAETSRVLTDADVLIIPSIARESYSLAAREALAQGVPVITSDCRGPEDVVEHGVNGLVVPTGDPLALAEAMAAIIDDPRLLRDLRRHARGTSITLREPTEHVATLIQLYTTLRP